MRIPTRAETRSKLFYRRSSVVLYYIPHSQEDSSPERTPRQSYGGSTGAIFSGCMNFLASGHLVLHFFTQTKLITMVRSKRGNVIFRGQKKSLGTCDPEGGADEDVHPGEEAVHGDEVCVALAGLR